MSTTSVSTRNHIKAKLVLEDGSSFEGYSFGSERSVSGECVFQTGMVGYPESLTDPSYQGQILVLTYPLIGNYGVPPNAIDKETQLPQFFEALRIHPTALLVSDYCDEPTHWNSTRTLSQWLKEQNVPALFGIDTRALTKKIRDRGSMLAKIIFPPQQDADVEFNDPNKRHLVQEVSTKQVKTYGQGTGDVTVIAFDCGMKYSQIKHLVKRGAVVKVVPYNYDLSKDNENYHGVFLSSGPGDPAMCIETIQQLQYLFQKSKTSGKKVVPIFGICLGHQLMALAAGAKTYKMKFGNRGHNQPCVDLSSGRETPNGTSEIAGKRCYLTSQNHGFAVDVNTLPKDWQPYFVNANDNTNEGLSHKNLPFFSVQFHPEANAGPLDTEHLFDKFLCMVRGTPYIPPSTTTIASADTNNNEIVDPSKVKKVLLLGSGGLSIGQAGEFDYSGSQAIKALKEEGIEVVLINPNIATVQTSTGTGLADRVYFLPITPEFVTRIIEKERPQGILVTFGGQTALNCGVELYHQKVFDRYNVKVLGTPIEAIIVTEDRELFAKEMNSIGEKIAPSIAAKSVKEAVEAANKIGYPVILRAAYALGGLGSGFANTDTELISLAEQAFAVSDQVLVERSIKGWKEIEYEVVRDCNNNCITVTNMENFDPLGIHTGDSIVIAPSQTLTDYEYNMLRSASIKVIRHLGVVGECNIQFALCPTSHEYFIIEVNARLSRSSALASKATGYPLAFVAAKLAVGKELPVLRNSVTRVSTACFEPSLDYVVVKMPLWDLKKFERVVTKIGTSMKSVGEVMAIGRSFQEAIQKAIRSVHSAVDGFQSGIVPTNEDELTDPSDMRILVIASALKDGMSVDKLHQLTKIDKWFLNKLKNINDLGNELGKFSDVWKIPRDFMMQLKQTGFSDKQIARTIGSSEVNVRNHRKELGVTPFVKQIDTTAAEVKATNNYLYLTYNGNEHDITFNDHGFIVLGSGSYRIGSSVEFDWCAVSAIQTISKLGYKSIMINYNPETVSTDYDVCDRLYFEELSMERVLDIYELEQAQGVIINMGGQIPNNLAVPLQRQNVKILGTSTEMIDAAENRYKFSRLLDSIRVDQPRWKELSSVDDIYQFCDEVGYPVLVRPSYVLSGAAMNVVYSPTDLQNYIKEASDISRDHPVVVSKFIEYAKEIEVDAVAKDGELFMHCISEHVENAGVHSGDATLVFPAQDLDTETVRKLEEATRKIASALRVSGPFNVQFLAKDNQIKVIECNLRASRSFPFVSKTLKFNLIEMATKIIMGYPTKAYPVEISSLQYVGVKVPQFSFSRLRGADPVLKVDMTSTGEVGCFGINRYEAFLKALLSTGFRLPKQNIFLSIGAFREKAEFLPFSKQLVEMGFKLFGSPGTADYLSANDIPITTLYWQDEAPGQSSNINEQLTRNIHLCIICPSGNTRRPASFLSRGYLTRRRALEANVPLITNIKFAKMFVNALRLTQDGKEIPIGPADARNSRTIARIPGLIDVHVHVREPGQEYKEDWDTCSCAALSGGITCIGAMPNTSPSIIDIQSFELVHKLAAQKARCDYGIYVGAAGNNSTLLPTIASRAFALKMYLDHTFTHLKLDHISTWIEHFKNWPKDRIICCHSENQNLAAVILLAELYDRPVHICHISRKEEIELVKKAKEKGIQVTCEVCPHHLFLTEADVIKLGEKRSQVRPMMGSEADRKALWDNIATIDCFATDHAPHTVVEKESEHPPPGFPGLETIVPLLLTAVHDGLLTLDDIIQKMYVNPKRIFGIPDQPDTYVEIDLDFPWKIPEAMPFSKCQWTPFAGRSVVGKILKVVLRGETVFQDGAILAPLGYGKDVNSANYSSVPHTALSTTLPIKIVPQSSPPPSPVKRNTSYSTPLAVVPQPVVAITGQAAPDTFASAPVPVITLRPPTEKPIMPTTVVASVESIEKAFLSRNILSVKQFTRDELRVLFSIAEEFKLRRREPLSILKGRVLATAFFEPSTRTQLSFSTAMERLGGSVITFYEQNSSSKKGESFHDTIRTLECYADAIVIRHPELGSVQSAARIARKPILNAGDGIGEHPTQALLDIFTIREELGTVNGLTIALVGDLKNGRTVHSLVQLLSLYRVAHLIYLSPPSLRMPREIIELLYQKGVTQTEADINQLEEYIGSVDVLYATRIQRERFETAEEYEKVNGIYCITPKLMIRAKEKMVVMHPLPRTNEISPEVDSDPRAAYFRQMENGMFVRMALLSLVIGRSL